MSDEQKATENEVFNQELSMDDLDAAAGGFYGAAAAMQAGLDAAKDDDRSNCDNYDIRQIYGGGGFPNCAATVEDGSWCVTNDACRSQAVEYKDIKGNQSDNCKKAWH